MFVSSETSAKPFLFSTSKWIFQRLFSSNSTTDHSTKNVEDLAAEGPIFHHNPHANKTNTNNETMEANTNTNQSQVVDLTRITNSLMNEDDLDNKNENETMNETPGILHRKISKILNKLQLYSAVRSTIHNVRKQQNGGDNNEESVSNNNTNKLERIVNTHQSNGYLPPKNNSSLPTEEENENKDGGQESAEKEEEEEEEVNIDFDERYDEPFVFDDEKDKKNDNKLSLETGNIGIHIMEVLGSIATIFISAAYQVGMYANSLTGTNEALVTTKPIEGMGTTIKWKIN